MNLKRRSVNCENDGCEILEYRPTFSCWVDYVQLRHRHFTTISVNFSDTFHNQQLIVNVELSEAGLLAE